MTIYNIHAGLTLVQCKATKTPLTFCGSVFGGKEWTGGGEKKW